MAELFPELWGIIFSSLAEISDLRTFRVLSKTHHRVAHDVALGEARKLVADIDASGKRVTYIARRRVMLPNPKVRGRPSRLWLSDRGTLGLWQRENGDLSAMFVGDIRFILRWCHCDTEPEREPQLMMRVGDQNYFHACVGPGVTCFDGVVFPASIAKLSVASCPGWHPLPDLIYAVGEEGYRGLGQEQREKADAFYAG